MDFGSSSAGHRDVALPSLLRGSKMRSKVRLIVGIIRSFVFLCGIRIAMTCHGVSPSLGDFLADLFGITAASRRGHRWLRDQPRPGNLN